MTTPIFTTLRKTSGRFTFAALLAGLLLVLFGATSAHAHANPPGCTGSGLGILLFTDSPDVHIGDTLNYSATIFNGTGNGPVVCDATAITASIVTPDGVTHPLTLQNTALVNGQSDYYSNTVSYVVRAQDVRPDGTVRATASDTGVIHQNDTDSQGGGNQGVNTEVSLPCIQLLVQCAGGVGENGAITFTGTVTNCGNNTLVGVTVTNFVNGGQFQVTFITNLLQGQIANFSGSWVPSNPCASSTATFVAQGIDQFTTHPRTVSSSNNTTCSLALTPGINVTKACPAQPVSPGQLLVFSGSVSNTGNVALNNIIVVDNQPALNTPVFTLATLAVGASANFTGSYIAPTNCSTSDTLTANASSTCGIPVTSTASVTCPILTTPQIAVTVACPATPASVGGSLIYNATVRNTGNITLANVVVLADRPSPNTTVFTAPSLAPGASASFTVSVIVPANVCSVTASFSGIGSDVCTANRVTNSVATTCNVITTPNIAVSLNCPAVAAIAGGTITYTGAVNNTGNVTLNNVTVVNAQSSPSTVLTVASLAPGASANFSSSFTAPATGCTVTANVTANGSDACTANPVSNVASATCPLGSTPSIVVTQLCPANPATPGSVLTYTGSVSNSGNITVTNVVVLNNQTGSTPLLTVATLAPGATTNFTGSYLAPTNCSSTSTSTATARSVCGVLVANSATTTCPILTTPQIVVTANCPGTPVLSGGSVTYSGTVQNAGNITLTNVLVVSDRPSPNTTVFTVNTLAPGASANFTGTYSVPANSCSISTTFKGTARDICTLNAVTNSTTTICPVLTTPAISVSLVCPATTATSGGSITYTGTVNNTGNVTLNNVIVIDNQASPSTVLTVPSLAAGASAAFTATFTTPADSCSVSSTVIATGSDNCTSAIVTNSASTTCPLLNTPRLVVTENCPAIPATLGGTLTYTGTVSNAGTITLTNVVVTNDRTGSTPVFTTATLAPGATRNFTGSYTVPLTSACGITSTLTANANNKCSGANVAASVTSTCSVSGNSSLAVSLTCPTSATALGGTLTYTGVVNNTGSLTLTNVTVTRDTPAPGTVIFSATSIAVGGSARFTNSYTVARTDACSSDTSVTARATDQCGGQNLIATAAITCPLISAPAIVITQNCPIDPTGPGGILTYTGSISNAGNITLSNIVVVNNQPQLNVNSGPSTFGTLSAAGILTDRFGVGNNFTGLTFAGQDEGYGATQFYAIRRELSGNSTFVTINANATVTARFDLGVKAFDALTFAAPDVGYGPVNFYYISHDSSGLSSFGVIKPGGVVGTVADLFVLGNNFDALTFSAPDVGYGANLFYYLRHDSTGRSFFGTINPALPGTITDRFQVANNSDALMFSVTDVGFGVNQFYYLRHDGTGHSTLGTITGAGVVTDRVTIGNNLNELTFTATDVGFGPNLFYFLSGNGAQQPVFTTPTLAPGASTNFTGSFIVAITNTCSVTSIATITATDTCSGNNVTNKITNTCPLTTAPALAVSLNCPAIQASTGGSITYTGTVSNTGNIALNNVVVTDTQASPSTVLTVANLAIGASANFTATFTAPANSCSVTSTVSARGTDVCTSRSITNTASATCPLTTNPRLVVNLNCSTVPVGGGSPLAFTGSVKNTGNVTITNIVVTTDRTGSSPVTTIASLAPNATANFVGTYVVPPEACSVTTTATATGADCNGTIASNSATTTCPVTGGLPSIEVTQFCPATAPSPGGIMNYTGIVANDGTVTLTNVLVYNNRSGSAPILTVPILAPGASATFSGSYHVPLNCCSQSSTATATGVVPCTGMIVSDTDTKTCPVLTTPAIVVTKQCPPTITNPGDVLHYSGSVSNSGDITLVNVTIVNTQPRNNTRVFGPITLAPGEVVEYTGSYTVIADFCGNDTVTAIGFDACSQSAVSNSVTTTCPVKATLPAIAVIKNCPQFPTPRGAPYTFTGTVTNTGNVTLTNVFVVDDMPTNNTPVIGPITLVPGGTASFSNTYTAPLCCCQIVDTLTATGQDRCSGDTVSATSSAECPLLTTPLIAVFKNCPSGTVPLGGLYAFTGSVTNTGNIVLTNVYVVSSYPVTNTVLLGPIELAPGESEDFSGSYTMTLATHPATEVITARGTDTCQGRTAVASANCAGPIKAITLAQFRLFTTGIGTVTPNLDGQFLQIGKTYTLTAKPGTGQVLASWTGVPGASSQTVLTFTMQGGVYITANFVPNPFLRAKGTFNGLFMGAASVENANSGAFTLVLSDQGAYTAALSSEGKRYVTSGRLNVDGTGNSSVTRPGATALAANWNVALDNSDSISGTVSDGKWVSLLAGDRGTFDARTQPALQAGKYTVVIPGNVGKTVSRQGDGYAAVTVNANGTVLLTGTLADGTHVSQSSAISKNGEWPVYVSLYAGRGSLLGWLTFTNRTSDDVSGRLSWIRPAVATSRLFAAGFATDAESTGSRYVAPIGLATRVLNITNGVVSLSGGNLSEASDNDVTLGSGSKVTSAGINKVTLYFTLSSGMFSGTFVEPGTTHRTTFGGAVLQKANLGAGYFPGTNDNGRVMFQAAP